MSAAARPYDYDPAKETANIRIHRLNFDDGYRVLCQDSARVMTWMDMRHEYGEDRWNTLGMLPGLPQRLLHVTWSERDDQLRLISVRTATPAEKRRHANRHHRS